MPPQASKRTTPKKKQAARTTAKSKAIVQKQLAVTSASEWGAKQQEGIIVEMPSGNVAKLRRTLDLPDLIKSGQIPNPLADIMRVMLASGGTSDGSALVKATENPVVMDQMLDMLDVVACNAMIEPHCERVPDDWDGDEDGPWSPSEGAISTNQMGFEDKMFIFAVAQGGAADLESFRAESERLVASVADVKKVEGSPE